jgi:hypothetical protein
VKAQLNDLSAEADVETTAEPEQLVTLILAKSPAASDQKAATGGRAPQP